MSYNINRKFRRKEQQEFSYEQYLLKRKMDKQIKKDGTMRSMLTDRLSAVVERFVPAWCHSVGKFCLPPPWYSKFIQFFLNRIYGPKHKENLTKRLMNGQISMWLYFRWIVAASIYWVTFKWMIWIKGQFDTLGVGTKMKRLPNGNVKFVITYWFRSVEEVEVAQ